MGKKTIKKSKGVISAEELKLSEEVEVSWLLSSFYLWSFVNIFYWVTLIVFWGVQPAEFSHPPPLNPPKYEAEQEKGRR